MNERIKELAEEADLHATLYFRKDQLTKFAELIVRECMGVCGQIAENAHKQKESSFLTADGKQLYNGVWGGAMNCGAGIANHFGIEK